MLRRISDEYKLKKYYDVLFLYMIFQSLSITVNILFSHLFFCENIESYDVSINILHMLNKNTETQEVPLK